MQEPLESRIDIGDGELCVFEWPGAGDPVLLLHATGFDSRCWDEVVLRLPGQRIYAVDIHFHGGSSDAGEVVDWGLFTRDICLLIEKLGLDRLSSPESYKHLQSSAGKYLEAESNEFDQLAEMLDNESSISGEDSSNDSDADGDDTKDFDVKSEPACYAMRLWSFRMEDLTLLDAMQDIAPIYSYLLSHLDKHKFDGKLRSDPDLWVD